MKEIKRVVKKKDEFDKRDECILDAFLQFSNLQTKRTIDGRIKLVIQRNTLVTVTIESVRLRG